MVEAVTPQVVWGGFGSWSVKGVYPSLHKVHVLAAIYLRVNITTYKNYEVSYNKYVLYPFNVISNNICYSLML